MDVPMSTVAETVNTQGVSCGLFVVLENKLMPAMTTHQLRKVGSQEACFLLRSTPYASPEATWQNQAVTGVYRRGDAAENVCRFARTSIFKYINIASPRPLYNYT
jgi:hypothetical protein